GVGEVAGVAAVERCAGWLDDAGAGGLGTRHRFVDFLARTYVLADRELRGTGWRWREAGVATNARAVPQRQHQAPVEREKGHAAVLELLAHDARCRPAEAIAIEGQRAFEVVDAQRHHRDPRFHDVPSLLAWPARIDRWPSRSRPSG